MAILTAYLDASGKKESPVLVVAGFLSPTVQWLKFEKDWKYCLAWYGKKELHMKDYAGSWGEYSSWKNDEPTRRRFLKDLIRVIKEHTDNSFAMAVHMSDYAEVNSQYRLDEWAHPYALVGLHCLGAIKFWAIKYGYDTSIIDHVFEAGDEGKGELFQLSSKHLLIDPIFKKKQDSVVFQAADLIAYEHYKANLKVVSLIRDGVEIEDFRIPFRLLADVPGSSDWGILDKENIVRDCVRHHIALR